ncbi:hypothetical protein JAAARDRAFT_198667 [Jaapia argillacea MUCL 33604]|uniref:C2H2-type domain-containing protein n=1 Tax=Jaapia argillacea MUCL 33604 TaxID=933084 RepID=A0A067PLX5_9AGAM|nr:hypothetical protein JAAARDRAFT_198667 [Jaapia argillacea MUCL 33604]
MSDHYKSPRGAARSLANSPHEALRDPLLSDEPEALLSAQQSLLHRFGPAQILYPATHASQIDSFPSGVFIPSYPQPQSYPRDQYGATPPDHPKAPAYSFTVLRSDPTTSSLEHVATSTNLQDLLPHQSGSNCTASGTSPSNPSQPQNASLAIVKAAPSFRVAVQPPPMPDIGPPRKKYRLLVSVDNEADAGSEADRLSADEYEIRKESPRYGSPSALQPSTSVNEPAPTSFTYTFDLSASSSTCHAGMRLFSEGDPENGAGNEVAVVGTQNQSGGNSAKDGRRHTCSICHKRFNRPSSLRIHETTHTGVKPFRCQWPGCGRFFNVNSNMRRHYRNHLTTGSPATQSHDLPTSPRRTPRVHGELISFDEPEAGEGGSIGRNLDDPNPDRMDEGSESDPESEGRDEDDQSEMETEVARPDSETSLSSLATSPSSCAFRYQPYPSQIKPASSTGSPFVHSYTQSHLRFTGRSPSRSPSPAWSSPSSCSSDSRSPSPVDDSRRYSQSCSTQLRPAFPPS